MRLSSHSTDAYGVDFELFGQRRGISDIDSRCKITPLMRAAARGNVDTMRSLLVRQAKYDLQDRWGQTALIYAAKKKQWPAVEYLLMSGADPYKGRDIVGNTLLMRIAQDSNAYQLMQFPCLKAIADKINR